MVAVTLFRLDPNSFNFPDADVIIAAVVKACRFRVRVSGHPLRDFDVAHSWGVSEAGCVEHGRCLSMNGKQIATAPKGLCQVRSGVRSGAYLLRSSRRSLACSGLPKVSQKSTAFKPGAWNTRAGKHPSMLTARSFDEIAGERRGALTDAGGRHASVIRGEIFPNPRSAWTGNKNGQAL